MTGDEVVTLVRTNYGDALTNFWTDAEIQNWVNQALQEVYTYLPPGDMREVVQEAAIALTSGRGDIPSSWDRVVSVFTSADGELLPMPSHVINAQRNLSDYFTPDVAGYSIDGNEILVTPDTISSVTAQYLVQPDEITNFTLEITGIPTRYHRVLADWATALAYSAEEDLSQAEHYINRAKGAVAGRTRSGE